MKTARLLAALWLSCAAARCADWKIEAPEKLIFNFKADAPDLSGISWVEGTRFLAVSNDRRTGAVFALDVEWDKATGAVESAVVHDVIKLSEASDYEGIVWLHARDSIVLSDERASSGVRLREFTPQGKRTRAHPLPEIFRNMRSNRGMESLTFGAEHFWTANEEALASDGPEATERVGTLVRLQRLDTEFEPAGQWAYLVDPHGGASIASGEERSGVADLAALPDGRLLVLERALGGGGSVSAMRARIYLADVNGATDVSRNQRLRSQDVTPVKKELLWEKSFGPARDANFEGICIGPELDEGARLLLLISDSGGGKAQHLIGLKLIPPRE